MTHGVREHGASAATVLSGARDEVCRRDGSCALFLRAAVSLGALALCVTALAGPAGASGASGASSHAEAHGAAHAEAHGTASATATARAEDIAEARERWARMSGDQRRQVRERFRQWRELDPAKREQVRENYRRLLAREAEASDDASTPRPGLGDPGPTTPRLSPHVRKRLERFAHDPVYRNRLRSLHTDLGPRLRHDRELLHALRRLPREHRRHLLEEVREEQRRDRVERMLHMIDADDEQAVAVHEILEDAAQRQGEVTTRLLRQRREVRQEAHQRLGELLGPEHAKRMLTPRASHRRLHRREGGPSHSREHHQREERRDRQEKRHEFRRR